MEKLLLIHKLLEVTEKKVDIFIGPITRDLISNFITSHKKKKSPDPPLHFIKHLKKNEY